MPLSPLPAPLIERLRRTILSFTPALMVTPFTREARTPASVPSPLMVMDLVMVTAPKPPGSRAEISPPAEVLERAPAKVLQGAVRLHGLASLPTPETQVRVCPLAAGTAMMRAASTKATLSSFMGWFPPQYQDDLKFVDPQDRRSMDLQRYKPEEN